MALEYMLHVEWHQQQSYPVGRSASCQTRYQIRLPRSLSRVKVFVSTFKSRSSALWTYNREHRITAYCAVCGLRHITFPNQRPKRGMTTARELFCKPHQRRPGSYYLCERWGGWRSVQLQKCLGRALNNTLAVTLWRRVGFACFLWDIAFFGPVDQNSFDRQRGLRARARGAGLATLPQSFWQIAQNDFDGSAF